MGRSNTADTPDRKNCRRSFLTLAVSRWVRATFDRLEKLGTGSGEEGKGAMKKILILLIAVIVGLLAWRYFAGTGFGRTAQVDVGRFLGKTKEEARQILTELSVDADGNGVWDQDKLPEGFIYLSMEFTESSEPKVCIYVKGQVKMPGDPEKVLDAIGLGELKSESRRFPRPGSSVLQCIAAPYETEIAMPEVGGYEAYKEFLVWKQGTRSLAEEWNKQSKP